MARLWPGSVTWKYIFVPGATFWGSCSQRSIRAGVQTPRSFFTAGE